jgi:Metallopeptidase family M24
VILTQEWPGGTAAATLHYMKNSEPLKGKLNLLLDAGAEYDCYASDIVRLLPLDQPWPLVIAGRHEHSQSMDDLVQRAEQFMILFSRCRIRVPIC